MLGNFARAACGLTLLGASLSAGLAAAQEAVLTELYGRGVHRYFSGNCNEAINDFSAAINGGTKDPRVFYFRALAELRQGREFEAEMDLQMGASLEMADVNQFYPVSKSLERVQGAARQTIERYRVTARAEAYERQHRRDAVRYEQRRRAEAEVLRKPGVLPPGVPAPPKPGAAAPAKPGEEIDDLFSDEADKKKPAPPADDATEAPAADDMPAEDAPPAAEPPDEAPAADAPAAAEPKDDDPFGDEAPK